MKDTWTNLRSSLNNNYKQNDSWKSVISSFQKRITHYYFDPIDEILAINSLKGEGFAILTLQCALIEMFAAFKFGLIHNYKKRKEGPSFEYRFSDESFIRFLTSENIFINHFFIMNEKNEIETNKPFDAKDFYDSIRCGLMHEARTKKNWTINSKKTYDGAENIFITQDPVTKNVRVDRTILNTLLKTYFHTYIVELNSTAQESDSLRRLFARKLDHLFDIPMDLEYQWWSDK